LALEERIGNVSTGLNEETIMKHLKLKKYSVDESGSQNEAEPCCVCQVKHVFTFFFFCHLHACDVHMGLVVLTT
jgi:hypothetical protein